MVVHVMGGGDLVKRALLFSVDGSAKGPPALCHLAQPPYALTRIPVAPVPD